ncbi:hypothetical protein A0H81_00363 [Grifola frondosa]|uniref:Methyltransferase ausD n=1 Tax=Grifola frondosa TaxID=5627 RepID=A0A1C7MUY0_GRIFR|nr:hypothetical protein A0H81_00363 [Grifola frondosa]
MTTVDMKTQDSTEAPPELSGKSGDSQLGASFAYTSITDEDLAFVGSIAGIQDAEALKKHILTVQEEAYAVHPYPCIRRFTFLRVKLSPSILLDVGCCFGNDACNLPRTLGRISQSPIELWDLGHKLFLSTKETFPVPFIAGDAFNPAHLEAVPPFYSPPETPVPTLSTLTSLNPLRGHVSAIHISAVFHLFDEEQQLQLARNLAGLLSPEPGSIIFGLQSSRPEKGFRVEAGVPNSHGKPMFCHNPESWTEMWDGQVFAKGTVKVDAILKEMERNDLQPVNGGRFWVMIWCVTRLCITSLTWPASAYRLFILSSVAPTRMV